MNIVLCSREDESRALAHGLVLCTPEEAEEYLMHYRTEGSKNGQRLYQYKDGSLTPLGRIHYGVGKGERAQKKADKAEQKAEKQQAKLKKAEEKYDKAVVKTGSIFGNKQKKIAKMEKAKRKMELERAKANILDRKASKLSDKVETAQAKEEEGNKRLEEDKTYEKDRKEMFYPKELWGKSDSEKEAWEKNMLDKAAQASVNKDNKEQVKKEYDKFELSDMARTEFNGNKEHDDALRDVPKDVIKDRIRLTRDWFNDEQFDTPEMRIQDLKNFTENYDKHQALAKKNEGDNLLSYLGEASEKINAKIWPGGKWDSKAYNQIKDTAEFKDYTELSSWLMDQVDNKSGSWNAGEFKKGSRAEKAYKAYAEVSDKFSNLYDKVSKETGYTFGKNYDKLIKAAERTSEWPALSKEFDRVEGDLLGAMLKDIGFRDTPENRYLLTQYAFID